MHQEGKHKVLCLPGGSAKSCDCAADRGGDGGWERRWTELRGKRGLRVRKGGGRTREMTWTRSDLLRTSHNIHSSVFENTCGEHLGQARQMPRPARQMPRPARQMPRPARQMPRQARQMPRQARQMPRQARQMPRQARQMPRPASQDK